MEADLFANMPVLVHQARRSHTEIRDPAEAPTFFRHTYGTKVRLQARTNVRHTGTFSLSRTRLDVGPVTIDEIRQLGHVRLSADPIEKAIVVLVSRGSVSSQCNGLAGRAAPGEITVLAQHDLPICAELHDLDQTSVALEPSLLAREATADPAADARLPIRFLSFAPKDAAASIVWQHTVRTVQMALSNNEIATPLVLGNASRLLAAVTLAVFANSTSAAGQRPADRTDHHPVLLRRAVEFIEANVDRDIGLVDIATAVRLTPRAVQYMFRRHLDTTPTQFLRRARLDQAHHDLVRGVRPHDTVAAIAARWGFVHTGRFAALYRAAYGRSPHTTLRGDGDNCPWLGAGR